MKTIIKLALLIFILSAFILPLKSAKAADTSISFQTDTQWSGWVKKDIVEVGSDNGLVLKTTTPGHYEPNGTLIYKVSPNGQATWGSMISVKTTPDGTNIDFSFSSSEMHIDETYAEIKARSDVKSNPADVGVSEFLYIRIDLITGAATVASPTLNSFGLTYAVLENPNVYVEKHVYRYLGTNPPDTRRTPTATFAPRDMVAVKIKLSATNAAGLKFKVEDDMVKNAESFNKITNLNGPEGAISKCDLKAGDRILPDSSYGDVPGEDLVVANDLDLGSVASYLCYTYFIPLDMKPKNDVQQVRLNVSANDGILATSNNYLMVRGFAYDLSDTDKILKKQQDFQIDDELLFSFDKIIFGNLLSPSAVSYASAPTYAYKRGLSANSRGGNLYSLPVTITDKTGEITLSTDSNYLLYNPSVYVMGNLFSKNSIPGAALDFGSKNNVVSGTSDEFSKLNAQASLYNYSIDQSSVAYWDSSTPVAGQPPKPKSQAMKANIERIIGKDADHRPENFCDLSDDSANLNLLGDHRSLYLNNNSCNIIGSEASSIWPDGRVWYFKPEVGAVVDLSAKIMKSGTLVFDFSNDSGATLNIGTKDFATDANIGIILINGGNVVFTKECNAFNGMIFAPGTDANTQGEIRFEEDGAAIKIRGSLVARQVKFAARKKRTLTKGDRDYAVRIYSDKKVLASRLPGFSDIMTIVNQNQ